MHHNPNKQPLTDLVDGGPMTLMEVNEAIRNCSTTTSKLSTNEQTKIVFDEHMRELFIAQRVRYSNVWLTQIRAIKQPLME